MTLNVVEISFVISRIDPRYRLERLGEMMNVGKAAILARFLKGEPFPQQLLRVFDPQLQQVLVRRHVEVLFEEHGKPGRGKPGFFRHVADIDRLREMEREVRRDPIQERR